MANKLTVCEITTLLYIFLYSKYAPIQEVVTQTDYNTNTVIEWLNHFQETMGKAIEWEPKLVGTNSSPVQIDEYYFRGKIKYHLWRILNGGSQPEVEKAARIQEQEKEAMLILIGALLYRTSKSKKCCR